MGQKLFLEFEALLNRRGLFAGSPATLEEREALFSAFLSVCRWVNVFYLWRPNLPDEADNHVLELAVAGGAPLIITHNISDFGGELQFPSVEILTPGQFLRKQR